MTSLDRPSPTAEELALRSQAGCLESFEQLVRSHESRVFNFLRRLTGNEHDAEDLTQETFLKAFRGLPSYRPALPFVPWLFVIARRTAASHFRSAKQFEQLSPDTEAGEENPASALEQRDEETSLWNLVRTLRPKEAEAVWLRYAEGFSTAEIGRIMGTNQIYVKVLLHRGRTRLAQMLVSRGTNRSKPKASAGRPNLKALLEILL